MRKLRRFTKKLYGFLGFCVFFIALADIPAKLAIWGRWFAVLSPHLHRLTFRVILGCVGMLICMTPWILELLKPKAIVTVEPVLNLTLSPHGENSESLYLEVMNNASPVSLSAEVHILSIFPKRSFKTRKFDGSWAIDVRVERWKSPHEQLIPKITIESSRSKRLKLASVISPVGVGPQIMELVGIDECLVWELLPLREHLLPYMEIEIILAGSGYSIPLIKKYKVGPRTSSGPLQMTEVTA